MELKNEEKANTSQIVIFGKPGHAEVLGLVGQTHSHAIVIEKFEDVQQLDFNHNIYLYSQTTKSLDEFHRIIKYIQQHISKDAKFRSFDTICRQVANRMPNIHSLQQSTTLFSSLLGVKVLTAKCYSTNV